MNFDIYESNDIELKDLNSDIEIINNTQRVLEFLSGNSKLTSTNITSSKMLDLIFKNFNYLINNLDKNIFKNYNIHHFKINKRIIIDCYKEYFKKNMIFNVNENEFNSEDNIPVLILYKFKNKIVELNEIINKNNNLKYLFIKNICFFIFIYFHTFFIRIANVSPIIDIFKNIKINEYKSDIVKVCCNNQKDYDEILINRIFLNDDNINILKKYNCYRGIYIDQNNEDYYQIIFGNNIESDYTPIFCDDVINQTGGIFKYKKYKYKQKYLNLKYKLF